MATSLALKLRGLYTSDNELSAVPEGALAVADNIVIDKEDVAEPRRGFDLHSTTALGAVGRLWSYKSTLFAHVDGDTLQYRNGSNWTSVIGTNSSGTATGTTSAPSSSNVYTAEANQNLYFATSDGVRKLSAIGGSFQSAGAPKGLDITASLITTTPTWLADTYWVRYRVMWGYKDANNNLVLGAPSPAEVVQNTAGGAAVRSVQLVITIPAGITTSWFVQVYRSAQSPSDPPSEELQLVYEANPTSGEITAKSMTIDDITPDELRGAFIYTAASQEGAAYENQQPPLCKDLAVFKNHLFFANTTSKHRYYLTLIAVNDSGVPTTGLAVNDTITVGGVQYTAKASETVASAQFALVDTGTPSQNIRDTAESLCRVINRHASSTVYAYYMSGSGELPGKILFEERAIGGASFAVVSSRATCWSPDLPSSGTTESSTSDAYPNGLSYSKTSQPEACPLPHTFQVGSKDKAIRRIVPLKDSLFVFKEGEGIFRVTGENSSSFVVSLLDSSAKLVSANSVAVINNQIFCLTDQGVVIVSETGVSVISRPIEADLLEMFGTASAAMQSYSFGVGYESERKYILWTVSSSSDTYATQAFIWNTFTNTWVRWTKAARCGFINPADDKLYIGNGATDTVLVERKTRTFSDHVDYGFATTITVVNGLTVTVGSGADNIAAGDVIYQSSTIFSIVDSVDAATSVVTLLFQAGFTVAAATVYKAIATEIEWVPSTLGNPASIHQIHTCIYLFKTHFVGTAQATFKSDLSPSVSPVTLLGAGIGNWGLFGFGNVPWGGEAQKRPVRTLVPRDKQVSTQLTVGFQHATGYSSWQLVGLSLVGEAGGERIAR